MRRTALLNQQYNVIIISSQDVNICNVRTEPEKKMQYSQSTIFRRISDSLVLSRAIKRQASQASR